MDPITAVGLALSVASLAGQVFTGCIQAIQFIITAKNLPQDSKYLNLRLRMEQQRLFAWSETSGLLDLDSSKEERIRETNTFVVHRTTILDLLVQIQCLFQEFEKAQRYNKHLRISPEPFVSDEEFIGDPGRDSTTAQVPLTEKRKNFIIKAMKRIKSTGMDATDHVQEGRRRLMWASFDREAFESLLQRFSTLNDNMTDILDFRLQTEIHRMTQDTNRGVLQLHKDISSLHQLVMALDIKMQAHQYPVQINALPYAAAEDASGLRLLAQLAKFKAFNESMDTDRNTNLWDEATAMALQLGNPGDKANTKIDKSLIQLLEPSSSTESEAAIRSEAMYFNKDTDKREKVWIEWKEYEHQKQGTPSPPEAIVDRVEKLAALLHHKPKPEAFRVPHCLGYFDNAHSSDTELDNDEEDIDPRIGFVFERPKDKDISPNAPPISLFELLSSSTKPTITNRIRLAHAVANCLLYLHSVNWLHKGLRSHNIVFFPIANGEPGTATKIDYSKPYLSGFDFARPARADEMTEVPGDVPEYNMYRHPSTQGSGFGPRESFRKSFDIYSLGVVLVELAHWSTIDKVLNIPKGKARITLRIRETLLEEKHVADVGANMGEVYENATRKCLAGGLELGIEETDDETSNAVAAKLSKAFYEDVVKKLGDVKV